MDCRFTSSNRMISDLSDRFRTKHLPLYYNKYIYFFTMSQKSRDKVGKSRDFVKKVGKSRETPKSREK